MGRTFSYRGGTQQPVEDGQHRGSRLYSHHEVLLERLFSLPLGVRLLLLDFLNSPRCCKIRHSACVCTIVLISNLLSKYKVKKGSRFPFLLPLSPHRTWRQWKKAACPSLSPFLPPRIARPALSSFIVENLFLAPNGECLEVSIECHRVSRKAAIKALFIPRVIFVLPPGSVASSKRGASARHGENYCEGKVH